MAESKFYHFSHEGIFYNTGSTEKTIMSLKEGGFVWFDFFEPVKEDLTALMDPLAKFLELTETYREIVTSLMELYTSLLNNLMTKASNETNSSVRRLTLIATIFMPLTLLASIGGMSEWSMMTGPANWKIAYPLFLAAMGLIAISNYLLIRRLEIRGLK